MPEQPSPPDGFEHKKWAYKRNQETAQRAGDKLDAFHTYVNEAAIRSVS